MVCLLLSLLDKSPKVATVPGPNSFQVPVEDAGPVVTGSQSWSS